MGMRIGILGLIGLCLASVSLQSQTLINYAGGYGSFDYDFYYGDVNIGLTRDGAAEGFIVNIHPEFETSLDTDDKVAGLASQRIRFNRNSDTGVAARMTMVMPFPTNDYPQPGETVQIRVWVKAANWSNARFRVFVRGRDGNNSQTLYDTNAPPTSWTELVFEYTVPTSNPPGIAVELRVDARAGVSQGTIWYDELRATAPNRYWREHNPRSLKIIAPYNPAYEEIQDDWVYYAREFDAVIAKWYAIKLLRTHRPDLQNVIYYNVIYSYRTPTSTSWADADLYGYWLCNREHPDWFLLNIYNQRQQFGSYLFLMDIGNPETSQWAAQNLALSMTYSDPGRDAVMLDSFIDFFFSSFHLQKYPTPASRIAAMEKHLRNFRAALEGRNIRFTVNAAGSGYTRDQVHTYMMRKGLIDGLLLEEGFTHIYTLPPGFVPFYVWESQLNTLLENANRLRIVYSGYSYSNPVEGRRQKIYALASFLLCVGGEIYLYLDKHPMDGPPGRQRAWRPDADFDVPLGDPTGPYQVLYRSSDYAGGLYYRPFQNGFVLVNPTGNISPSFKDGAVFTYILDADYWELWSGQVFRAGTRVKLYPKQARIFVRVSGLRGGSPPLNQINQPGLPLPKPPSRR
jgi:hypothetical protein